MPNQDDIWPRPSFYFKVMIPSLTSPALFQQLSGLDAEPQGIEYRHGGKPEEGVKMPDKANVGDATLHRGVFVNDEKFAQWFSKIATQTNNPENIVIQLLDEKGKAIMWWTLINARPTRIIGADLKSEGNEAAIGTLELAYEKMTANNG